jgi:hypothetical protein
MTKPKSKTKLLRDQPPERSVMANLAHGLHPCRQGPLSGPTPSIPASSRCCERRRERRSLQSWLPLIGSNTRCADFLLVGGDLMPSDRNPAAGASQAREMEDDPSKKSASALPWNQWLEAFGNLLETLNRARTAPDSERGRYVSELTAVATFIST